MEDKDQLLRIETRIGKIEQRIIDLIVPIQNIAQCLKSNTDIQYLIDALKGPIPVDHGNLKNLLNSFSSEMRSFDKSLEKMNDIVKVSHVGEIKYIGNRLNEIEKILKKLLEDQPKKEVQIQFSCDGYDLVNKPIGYDPTEEIEESSDKHVHNVLGFLSNKRIRTALINRYGLFGQQRKTYPEIGKILGVSRSAARNSVERGIWELRRRWLSKDKIDQEKIEKLPPGKFKDNIKGK